MPATRSTRSTTRNAKDGNSNTTDKSDGSATPPAKQKNNKASRLEVSESEESDVPNPKKEKLKYLHYTLRKACRKAIARSDSEVDEDADLKVRLSESWEYTFDQSLDDLKVINDKFELEPAHVQDICRQVYHNCILITEGEKFKALLSSQGLNTESVTIVLEQLCKTDGSTDANRIGGTMKKVAYQKLCKIYRDMAIEQVKTLHKKCFSKEMLQRDKGQLSGVRSVVHNTAEPISDSSKYAEAFSWLTTCTFTKLKPVRAKSGTSVTKATSSDASVTQMVANVRDFVAQHAQTDMTKVDDFWNQMVKAIYEISAQDTITEALKVKVKSDVESSFDDKFRADMLDKGRKQSNDPLWTPMPSEESDYQIKYNRENDKTKTVERETEDQLNKLVKNARKFIHVKIATVARNLQEQLVTGLDANPFLKIDEKDGKIYTKLEVQERKRLQEQRPRRNEMPRAELNEAEDRQRMRSETPDHQESHSSDEEEHLRQEYGSA